MRSAKTGPAEPPQKAKRTGLTARALVLGGLLTALEAIAIPYSDNRLQGTWISCCHLPIVTFFFLLVIVAVVNNVLKRVSSGRAFSVREIMVIYAMTLVGSGIPSFQLTEYLFPTLAGVRYFATPENKWAQTFFQYIPSWVAPTDPNAIRAFFEGLRPGEAIPWQPWVVPALAWTALALLIFWTYACLTVALRRQWVENEHLLFPLVQVPLDMVEDDGRPLSPFLRSKPMWIAAAIPTLIHSWNGLHTYYPVVPALTLSWNLNQYLHTTPWNQVGIVTAVIHFSIIGFSFLIATDLSFSLWFFFILFQLLSVALFAAGVRVPALSDYATRPENALQMLGAFFLVAGYILYLLRGQLRMMFEKAFGGPGAAEIDDSGEPMSYTVAVWGLLIGIAGVATWCSLAGMRAWVAGLSMIVLLVISLVLTRIVNEGGLLFVQAPFRPTDIYSSTVGSSWLTARDWTISAFVQRVFMFDLRTFVMPTFMDSYKIGNETGINLRRLLPALGVSIVISIIASYGSMMYTAFRYGGVTLSGWFCVAAPPQPFKSLMQVLAQPRHTTAASWVFILIGFFVTWGLSLARTRFTWWPLHPLGYTMGPSWPMIQLWFSVLIGWLFKVAIMRYSTARSYRQARQFFLGLVVGEFGTAAIWVIISWVTGTRGTRFFLN